MFKVVTFVADLEKEEETKALAAEVLKCFDQLDILVRQEKQNTGGSFSV